MPHCPPTPPVWSIHSASRLVAVRIPLEHFDTRFQRGEKGHVFEWPYANGCPSWRLRTRRLTMMSATQPLASRWRTVRRTLSWRPCTSGWLQRACVLARGSALSPQLRWRLDGRRCLRRASNSSPDRAAVLTLASSGRGERDAGDRPRRREGCCRTVGTAVTRASRSHGDLLCHPADRPWTVVRTEGSPLGGAGRHNSAEPPLPAVTSSVTSTGPGCNDCGGLGRRRKRCD